MRERYRKARRKQQAQFLLLGCVGLLLAGLGFVAWRLVAPRTEPDPDVLQSAEKEKRERQLRRSPVKLPEPPGLKAGGELHLIPAPWLVDSDGTQLYSLTDLPPYADFGGYYSCDEMSASQVPGRKETWSVSGEFKAGMLDLAGDKLITLQESAADKTLTLNAYSTVDGSLAWTQQIAAAARGKLLASGKHVVLTYSASGGPRISCFSASDGAKAWGLRPPLRGLKLENNTAVDLQLFVQGGDLVYHAGNLAGYLELESGDALRNESYWPGRIRSVEVEAETHRAIVQIQGNRSGQLSVFAVPLDGGEAQLAQRILAADDHVLTSAGARWLLSVYRRVEAGTPRLVIDCQTLDEQAPSKEFRHELAGGSAICSAWIAGSDSFLLGVAAESAAADQLTGARQFYLISPAVMKVEEAGRTSQPAYDLLPFKRNLLALCDGGLLMRFDPQRLRFRQLKKLRYPQFGLRPSDDGESLLAWSSTEAYMEGQAGEPMQTVIIR